MECRLELVWLSGESDAPINAILVEIGCGIDGVGEALVFADFLEEPARHAGAHGNVKERKCATVAVTHETAVKTQTPKEVRLRDVAFLHDFDALI